MKSPFGPKPIEIFVAEDNPGDVRLIQECLKDIQSKTNLHAVTNSKEAVSFLQKQGKYAGSPNPHMILLDLNLPPDGGLTVLKMIKTTPVLRRIPTLMLSTSEAAQDVATCYDAHANAFIAKPIDLDQFLAVFRAIELFWFHTVTPGSI